MSGTHDGFSDGESPGDDAGKRLLHRLWSDRLSRTVTALGLADLQDQALRLLDRRPPAGPPLPPEVYVPGSLPELIERLGRPETPLAGPALVSLCLKYAHAYVHPERLGDAVSLADVTRLAGQFVLRRCGTPLLAQQPALRQVLLQHGFALQMLLDLPKTAHLLACLAGGRLAARERAFVGLDCGAGTGILLIGHALLARRNGWRSWHLTGLEHLPQVAERADRIVAGLGVGRVVQADATRPETFRPWAEGPVDAVSNETLPSAGRRLYKEPFPLICQALFAGLGSRLAATRFLPEAVWASDRTGTAVRLAPENAFGARGDATGEAPAKPLGLYYMRDVGLGGQRLAVTRVGEPYAALVAEPWRDALGRRW